MNDGTVIPRDRLLGDPFVGDEGLDDDSAFGMTALF